jgi:prolipoprotein diacylglyceryl transferase
VTLASFSPQAALPSPTTAVWHLGPVPIRAYALCIVLGIVLASVVTEVRLRRRGVAPGAVLDIAVYAVPTGIIGARIYHLITSPQAYFGAGGDPIRAFYIWEGGLGIWGAVAGGALGAWFAARQLGIPLTLVADALAPGLPLAQAVGRFGNWFNNELYGDPTTLPWGLEIHKMDPANPGQALRDVAGNPVLEPGLYQPTFAYEALWNVGVALLVYLVDRRFKLGRGRAFALYVIGYTAGRFWIELMRTDPANHILGLRVNVWVAGLVFIGGLIYFLRVRGPREYVVPAGGTPTEVAGSDSASSDISQVDVSRRSAAAPPEGGYQVVTEPQYLQFRETGKVPGEPVVRGEDTDAGDDDHPGEPHDLLDDFADDESTDAADDADVIATAKKGGAGDAHDAAVPDGQSGRTMDGKRDGDDPAGHTGQERTGVAAPGIAERDS